MKQFVIGKSDEGQKLKKILFRILDKAPQSFTYKMLRKKNITLNDKKASGDEVLCNGDIVKLYLADDTFLNFSSVKDVVDTFLKPGTVTDEKASRTTSNDTRIQDKTNQDIKTRGAQNQDNGNQYINRTTKLHEIKALSENDIIYRDDDIMLINKGYGILSQKARADDVSINEMMLAYLSKNGLWVSSTMKPSICNRLDRNTTGIILAGVSIKGLQLLTEAVRERKLDKYYRTICYGRFEKRKLVRSYLSKDEKNNKVNIMSEREYVTSGSPKNYSPIETEYSPVSYSEDGKLTLLEVKLITGKSHQIRAQLASLGYPIIGDRKYSQNAGFPGLKSQLLHAYKISFGDGCDKYSGRVFTCPYPEWFEKILNKYFEE